MQTGTTENIIEIVGNTPLLHLARFSKPPLADIYATLWKYPESYGGTAAKVL